MLDVVFAKHSAFSYEDLPSDRFGSEFGARYFDKSSSLSLGEQIDSYLNNRLKATLPNVAPNYSQLPEKDIGIHSGTYNPLHLPSL